MIPFLRAHVGLTLRPSTLLLPTQCRHLSSTSIRCQAEEVEEEKQDRQQEEEEEEEEEEEKEGGTEHFDAWIQSEGLKWRYPDPVGPKWLGGNIPFPRNPTFKPPTPLSDNLRNTIYKSYVTNPTANDPHTLSTRYGVSIPRIEAIIRLKDLEANWKEKAPLQTGFLKGMEYILGVNVGGQKSISEEISSSKRSDVNEADELSRCANEDGMRKRGLSRTFFEPVDEGQEAAVPRLLDEHREKAAAMRVKRMEYPTIVVRPNPLKPAFKFVDVGLRWFDAREMERRHKESIRRKAIKAGKRTIKLASGSPS